MEFRDRTTSLMKKKEEMLSLKNRDTIKPKLIVPEDEEFKEMKPEMLQEKKTLVKEFKTINKSINEMDINEREYSTYEDPSLNASPKSMKSVLSLNERRHLEINIKKMIDLIEKCCTNPLKQVEYMVELFKGVDFILNHEDLWEEIFKCDVNSVSSQSRLCKDMDYFLYNSLILIENQEQLRSSLLSIIANMAVINYPPLESFGFKCLKSLKELINNDNPAIKNLAIKTLKNVIIPLIKKSELLKISYNILNGVNLILTNSFNKESSLFEPDLMLYGSRWLLQIKEAVENVKELEDLIDYFRNYEEFCFHYLILNFLSNLTIKPDFALSLAENIDFKVLISLFEMYSQWKVFKPEEEKARLKMTIFERTNALLQIMINLSPFINNIVNKSEIADFVNFNLEKKQIEILLKDFDYKSDNYYKGECKTEESINELKNYYQSLSTMLIAYSKLLHFKDITVFDFKEEAVYKSCASQVLALIHYDKLDPKILTSCAIFVINLLKHPSLEEANDLKIHKNIRDMLDFMPFFSFINGANYEALCFMATLYYKPIMDPSDDGEYYEIPEQRLYEIQEAFFHMVRLIKFLSNFKYQNSKSTFTANFAGEVCQNSTFVRERNFALFKLWELPNDNVKLLVSRTFSCINAAIWKYEDLKIFLEMLRELKTFNKKNSDEIIAELLLTFSKVIYNKKMEGIFAEVIDLCFEILLNNMERNFRDLRELNNKKIQISVSCIYFLRRMSAIPELRNNFLTPKLLFLTKRFFFLEEKYMTEMMTPLLLEDTWVCSNIEHLLQSTSGNEQIQANSLLGFRLISRIADILQGKVIIESDEDVDVLEKDLSKDEERLEEEAENFRHWYNAKPSIYVNRISRYFERNLINKMKNELSPWKQFNKIGFMGNVMKAMQNAKKETVKQNKKKYEDDLDFNGQQIVYRLAMFVLMKQKSFQNKGENSYKTSLLQKIKEYKKGLKQEKMKKEKISLYEQMQIKNPLAFDPKKLRGKEILEIVYQGLPIPNESELLFLYRSNFFDVNNTLFLDYSKENFIKIKSESPLKKRVVFELIDSFNESLDKSNNSPLRDTKTVPNKPKIETISLLENANSVISKRGVEKLLESLNNNSFEDIISDIFSTQNENKNRNTILLSALFRAMHFAYKNSHLSEEEIIKSQLNSINVVRGLTKLASSIGWINSNIGFKYLKAVRFYYTMPQTCSFQDPQMLQMYEIVFKSVNHMLKDIKNHCLDVNEKDLLKMEVLHLMNEVSNCAKVLLEQIRTIIWTKKVDDAPKKTHKKEKIKTLQDKCVEFVVNSVLPLKNIRVIVKILLSYYKIFSDYSLTEQFDSRALTLKEKIITNFQSLIAWYLSICDDKKYDILYMFSEYEHFSDFPVRQTFINEIIKENDRKQLSFSLEKYLMKKSLFLGNQSEIIQILANCLYRKNKEINDQEIILLITNKGFYTLKLKPESCHICPKYTFCDDEPIILNKHPFDSITNFISLEGDQRFFLSTAEKKKEELFFFQFLQPDLKNEVEKILRKKKNIIWLKDSIYDDTISSISISNKLIIWVYVSLEKNRKMRTNLLFQRRLFVLSYSNQLFILEENPEKFNFNSLKVVGEGFENIFSTKKKKAKKQVQKNLLEIERKAIQSDLKRIAFHSLDENFVFLNFNDGDITLKFDCDLQREKFRQEILNDLQSNEWKKTILESAVCFERKLENEQEISKSKLKKTKKI